MLLPVNDRFHTLLDAVTSRNKFCGVIPWQRLRACEAQARPYGRRGRINARELWEQMSTCSCLNLILACIVYWQACEISRVLSECDPIANGIDLSLLEHVSPRSSILKWRIRPRGKSPGGRTPT
jgi:hypothetical protein